MIKQNLNKNPLDEALWRVFLDSSILQTLQDYGEFIYDGGEIAPDEKIWSIPDGFTNISALREVVAIWWRGSFELALSHNSLQEVLDRGKHDYLQWALEMLDYWEGCLATCKDASSPFSGRGKVLATKIGDRRFGYLSQKDARLIEDAVLLECDVFLTMEKRLPKNASHIERDLGIKVLQPIDYLNLLRLWPI
ncbi:MAG: hypothetical protein AB1638_04870 [Nitrospirota bacterium]